MERIIATHSVNPSAATSERSVHLPSAEPTRPQSSQHPVASPFGQSSPPSPEIQQQLSVYLASDLRRTKALQTLISLGEKGGAEALLEVAANKKRPLDQRLDSLTGLSEFSGELSGAHIKSIGLIAADTSEDRYVAEAALKTLGTLDDIRAARELVPLAAKGGALGQAAILELGQSLASLQGIAPQLIELYQGSNPQTSSKLLPRLTELRDPTAFGLVSQALLAPHVSPSTKENIITKVLDSSPDHAQKFLPILGKVLYSSSAPEVRLKALNAITRIARHIGLKSSQAIISPLREVADSPDDPCNRTLRLRSLVSMIMHNSSSVPVRRLVSISLCESRPSIILPPPPRQLFPRFAN